MLFSFIVKKRPRSCLPRGLKGKGTAAKATASLSLSVVIIPLIVLVLVLVLRRIVILPAILGIRVGRGIHAAVLLHRLHAELLAAASLTLGTAAMAARGVVTLGPGRRWRRWRVKETAMFDGWVESNAEVVSGTLNH